MTETAQHFDEARLAAELATLSGWSRVAGPRQAIAKEFVFADFKQAWAFMSRIAAEADARDHHPEWSNVYNRVSILLTTHDAGGVTAKDIALARFSETTADQTLGSVMLGN